MFSVFNANLQTDMRKTIVRRHLANTYAQSVWKELSEHMRTSSKGASEKRRLTQYVTNTVVDDNFKGTTEQFVLHFNEQFRQLDEISEDSEKLPPTVKLTLLQTAVRSINDLRIVETLDEFQSTTYGHGSSTSLSYETYYDPILDFVNSQCHSSEDLDQALQAYQAYQVPCPQDSTLTPERTINHHFTYHVAQASQAKHGSLVDRGANGGLAGSDVRILSRSSRKCTGTGNRSLLSSGGLMADVPCLDHSLDSCKGRPDDVQTTKHARRTHAWSRCARTSLGAHASLFGASGARFWIVTRATSARIEEPSMVSILYIKSSIPDTYK